MTRSTKETSTIKHAYPIAVLCFWIFVWELVSRVLHNAFLLPSPGRVLHTVIQLVDSVSFWRTIAFSSLRIVLGFFLALLTGTVAAVLAYLSRLFRELISPLMKVIKSTPVASFIILALVWIPSKNLSVLISFLMIVPIIFTNVLQGLITSDEKLLQLATVFRLGRLKRIKAIYLPAIQPFLISAISVGLGFGFKAGIAAEVIGNPANSIGRRLYEAKLYYLMEELFAWTIIIILISVFFEKAVMLLLRLLHFNKYSKSMRRNRRNNKSS